jgi:hypothetical protein
LAGAERAVRADPVDAGSLSALGAAGLAARDWSGAAAAFRIAGGLGWRDRATQLYWLAASLQAGELAIAAERLDALLRQDPALAESPTLLSPFEDGARGRRILAERLAPRPPWFTAYWSSTDKLSADRLSARARLLDEPALRPASVRCDELTALIEGLFARGREGEARSVWQRHCPGAGKALVADGGFERIRLAASTPFDWQVIGQGGLDVRIGPSPGMKGNALIVASTLPGRRVFAVAAVALAPGRYRIGWSAVDAAADPSPRIAVRLTCERDSGPFSPSQPSADKRFVALAEMAPGACAAPWLELAIAPGSGAVAVDDVAIARVD